MHNARLDLHILIVSENCCQSKKSEREFNDFIIDKLMGDDLTDQMSPCMHHTNKIHTSPASSLEKAATLLKCHISTPVIGLILLAVMFGHP